jgi:sec-independent protein translocase protein TatB
MFNNIGWGEMLLLVVIGLVVLGPERLPGAIRWATGTVRQARDYLSGATSQLREEMGPEFDDLREPLSELQKLRGMTPRAALTKHLLDGDDSWLTGNFDGPGGQERSDRGVGPGGQERSDRGVGPLKPQSAPSAAQETPAPGHPGSSNPGPSNPAPFDPDAT